MSRESGALDDRLAGVDEATVACDRLLHDRSGVQASVSVAFTADMHERVPVVRAEVEHLARA